MYSRNKGNRDAVSASWKKKLDKEMSPPQFGNLLGLELNKNNKSEMVNKKMSNVGKNKLETPPKQTT